MKRELEKYIGKLGTTIVDSNIQYAVNFMFQTLDTKDSKESSLDSSRGINILPPAPTIDSKTGLQVWCQEGNVCSESSESSIYLMQNLRIGNSDCLTFFETGANAHLINGQLANKEKLQLISSKSTALGVI